LLAKTAPDPAQIAEKAQPAEPTDTWWRLRVEVDEPGSRVTVAVDESGTIVGLATAGATRDEDAPAAWELYSINVLAERLGSGVADDLMAATVGERDATVWVLVENERARAFYARHGFGTEGASRVHEGGGAAEMRLVRRCGPPER
jgi:ribosomal protein S18 acetylase RimI-like enzyme